MGVATHVRTNVWPNNHVTHERADTLSNCGANT